MEFSEVIKKRRSVRAYKSDPVSKEQIRQILEIVQLAPSGGNLQAYKITVVRDEEVKDALVDACGGQEYLGQAPVALVFWADGEQSAQRYGERGRDLYAVQDATIAATYAQLAAVEQGLATVWIGAFNEGRVQQILDEHVLRPVAILPVGYAEKLPERMGRREQGEMVEEI